jgi:hypothetical protein
LDKVVVWLTEDGELQIQPAPGQARVLGGEIVLRIPADHDAMWSWASVLVRLARRRLLGSLASENRPAIMSEALPGRFITLGKQGDKETAR